MTTTRPSPDAQIMVPLEPAIKLGMTQNKNKQPVLVVCHVVLFVVVLLDLDRTGKIAFITTRQ